MMVDTLLSQLLQARLEIQDIEPVERARVDWLVTCGVFPVNRRGDRALHHTWSILVRVGAQQPHQLGFVAWGVVVNTHAKFQRVAGRRADLVSVAGNVFDRGLASTSYATDSATHQFVASTGDETPHAPLPEGR